VGEAPLLVTVEQRGIDLVVEARGPRETFAVNVGDRRWGPELLVLESAGGHRIEVRPREKLAGPGRYTIRMEALALSIMSRAGREAFARTPKAQRRAIALYREALAEWRSLGEHRWEAEALYSAALNELQIGEPRPAIENSLLALTLWRQLGEPYREATVLGDLGAMYMISGENEKAREPLRLSLALWQRLGERSDELIVRFLFCYLEQSSGAMPAAVACYEDVREQLHEVGDLSLDAVILNNLGGIYDALGEPDSALACYREALSLWQENGERRREARILSNMATVHTALGEWQEALRLCGQAREILRRLGDRDWETRSPTSAVSITAWGSRRELSPSWRTP
jgi:tetratricopeptide (TPR) repeat protein